MDLSDLTTFKMNGKAKVIKPLDLSHFEDLLIYFLENKKDFKIIGGGSNTVVKDGIKIPFILTSNLNKYKFDGEYVIAESGVKLSILLSETIKRGISGLEFSIGIPGTIGGAIFMNTGAFDGEISKCVESVEIINEEGKTFEMKAEDLKFSYRHSLFHEKRMWIKKCVLKLQFAKNKEDVLQKSLKNWSRKRSTQPITFPSVGCVFKNPPNEYAARLIDNANLKGYRVGGVEVSKLHAGFFINVGNATFEDFKAVYEEVVKRVREKFGVELESEITIVS
ncbi:MAG: UDP-N-acetylmuramate dehydrogenase [Athalassotoga sp.]|uniref:UDP-N-acetylmuramate dehydrogenase n=2 Tax=Athalassotoga sp. TaxID=2022597 RepID=UPI003CFC1E14